MLLLRYEVDPGSDLSGAKESVVVAIQHHFRPVHVFRFEDPGTCNAWKAGLESAAYVHEQSPAQLEFLLPGPI